MGSASSATSSARDDERGFGPDVARSILQQWTEVRGGDGSIERVFTQVAQTWPLSVSVKFDNIEAAIQALRPACDYLYRGLNHVGSTVEQKANAEKTQEVASAMVEMVERVKMMQEQMAKV